MFTGGDRRGCALHRAGAPTRKGPPMGSKVIEVLLKAVAGGLFVLAFAALAQMITPKRLAGVFSAAPSVAIGSLLVTVAFKGAHDVTLSAAGMVVGAVAFFVYCVAVVPLIRRWGA